jgi:hypothetical protein
MLLPERGNGSGVSVVPPQAQYEAGSEAALASLCPKLIRTKLKR